MNTHSDPKALVCDASGIRWERTWPSGRTAGDAPRTVRPSAVFFNRGQQTWPLIARSKPAAGTYWASASPVEAVASPGSTPFKQGFSVKAKNAYGASVVAIKLELVQYLDPTTRSRHDTN